MRLRSVFLSVLAGTPLLQGCVALGAVAGAGVGVVAMQERTMGEGMDDALASNSIKTRLAAVDRSGYRHVDVEVAGGRVLLSGSVMDEEHKQTAELLARSSRAIRQVYNEIQVGPPEQFARSAQDDMITAQVRTRLVASRNVRGVDVNIETHRGTVYLMGVTRTEDEVRRAAEIASVVPGVSRVVSLMTARETARVETAQTFEPAPQYAPPEQQMASTPY